MSGREIVGNWAERLLALTDAYRGAQQTWEHHRDQWQRYITDLVDAGIKPATVAAAMRPPVSAQRIAAIVERQYRVDQDRGEVSPAIP